MWCFLVLVFEHPECHCHKRDKKNSAAVFGTLALAKLPKALTICPNKREFTKTHAGMLGGEVQAAVACSFDSQNEHQDHCFKASTQEHDVCQMQSWLRGSREMPGMQPMPGARQRTDNEQDLSHFMRASESATALRWPLHEVQ